MAQDDDLQEWEQQSDEQGSGKSMAGDKPPPNPDDILTMEKAKAGKLIIKLYRKQDDLMKSREVIWKANKLRRSGQVGIQLIKKKDQKQATVWIPPGPQVPALNKADRLCRRMASTVYADPPVPELLPAGDEDEDRDAADFAQRALIDLGGEGQLDDATRNRQAFDRGSTYGSGFRHYYVDPTGNGSRPMQVEVNAEVMTLDQAMQDPGEEPLVLKYVTRDGTLTTEYDEDDVRVQWLPALKSEVLDGRHVRFLPPTSRDIWDCEGIAIGAIRTLGELKRKYPDLKDMTPERLEDVLGNKPKGWRDLLPTGMNRVPERPNNPTDDEGPDDDSLVFYVTVYYKRSTRFPKGVLAVAAGKGVLLYRGPWQQEMGEVMDIPVSQHKQIDDDDDPYGRGLMALLGDGNEIRAAQIGTFLEHLDRFSRRKTFVPVTSTLQAEEMRSSTGWLVPINPGGEPIFEQLPDFPQAAEKMLEFVTSDMDDESGLQETAQGLASPSVESGLHAQRIIEQVLIGLSDMRENAKRAVIRGWRIELQLLRRYFTIPQKIHWVGEDGAYKQRMWDRTDLGSTADVKIMQGSFTSLTASAKAATVTTLAELQVADPTEIRRMIMGTVGAQTGMRDDPHRQRVRRQIARWEEGPNDEFNLSQPGSPDEEAAAMELQQIFDPRPNDQDPAVAMTRYMELSRTMSSIKFRKFPPFWQAGLIDQYEQMRQAAGIQTLAEQQQAEQQMMEQQQQAEQAAQQQAAQQQQAQQEMQGQQMMAQAEQEQMRGSADIEKQRVASEGRVMEAAIAAQGARDAANVKGKERSTER